MLFVQIPSTRDGGFSEVEISQNPAIGAVLLASMPLYKFQNLGGWAEALANDARQNPAQKIPVPNTTLARGLKPRNRGFLARLSMALTAADSLAGKPAAGGAKLFPRY